MKSFFLPSVLLSLSLLILAGCGGARYVETEGPGTIVSVDQINIQDWIQASDALVQDLLESGAIDRPDGDPAVMAVSRIVNNTTQQVDTNLLTRRIRITLNRSGRALTSTTVGLGEAEDPLARDQGEFERFMGDGEGPRQAQPQYSLSGRIIEDRARAGRTRQASYVFQLALTEIGSGLAVWEGEEIITKQGRRATVGW